MTNKATRDARVAEIVGYRFYGWFGKDETYDEYVCWAPGKGDLASDTNGYRILKGEDMDFAKKTEMEPDFCDVFHPFISAPTFATDGIVLEWVQENIDFDDSIAFWKEVYFLVKQVSDRKAIVEFPHVHMLMFLQPGMYAKALLAAKDKIE